MSIFVFGSNTQGRHGAGAALHARIHFGAIYGVPMGPQGNAYAIITKELRLNHPQVTLSFIASQVSILRTWWFHHGPPDTLIVTRIGCGLAGFTDKQISPMFTWAHNSPRILLPKEWS